VGFVPRGLHHLELTYEIQLFRPIVHHFLPKLRPATKKVKKLFGLAFTAVSCFVIPERSFQGVNGATMMRSLDEARVV
jgi:hypothetical protein